MGWVRWKWGFVGVAIEIFLKTCDEVENKSFEAEIELNKNKCFDHLVCQSQINWFQMTRFYHSVCYHLPILFFFAATALVIP